jgi:hypothetical protein
MLLVFAANTFMVIGKYPIKNLINIFDKDFLERQLFIMLAAIFFDHED